MQGNPISNYPHSIHRAIHRRLLLNPRRYRRLSRRTLRWPHLAKCGSIARNVRTRPLQHHHPGRGPRAVRSQNSRLNLNATLTA